VRARVEPLDQRIEQLESGSKQTRAELEEVRTTADRADERAVSAGEQAAKAGEEAAQAGKHAGSAAELAGGANAQAIQNSAGLNQMDRRIDSLDDFDLTSTETISFKFDSSRLSASEQEKLDGLAGQLGANRPYFIEIQGFTDRAGSSEYNLALSRRRADRVARYLATEHNVPLRRLGILGFGSDDPVADNSTRAGRRRNRRVEVRLYLRQVVNTARQTE